MVMNTARSLHGKKSNEDFSSVDESVSSHQFTDSDSRPSTACSSSDMCTPMPHTTTHTFESKQLCAASVYSSASSTPVSMVPSDVESSDSLAPSFSQPDTPPTVSAPHQAPGDFTASKSQDDSALYAAIQSWHTGAPVPSGDFRPTEIANLFPDCAEHQPGHHAFDDWHHQPASQQQPVYDYHPTGPSLNCFGGHNRSDSYQSTTSSMDSWNSNACGDVNFMAPSYLGSLAASFSQMNLNPTTRNLVHGMTMYPSNTGATSSNQNSLAGAQSLTANFGNHKPSPNVYNNFANSLAALSAVYSNPQVGHGSQPLVDPQKLMAYTAAFGSSSLLDLYALNPELFTARTNVWAQLGAGSTAYNPACLAPNASVDNGPSLANKKTNLYKTELCRSWEEKGTCRYGTKCQFAHGQEELKNVSRHPKFKTEICRTFWLHGSCPYGKRCCFLHTTATEAGVPATSNAHESKQGNQPGRNAHDPPTSRLQQRISSGPLSATPSAEQSLGVSLSSYLSSSPQLQSAPVARSLSDMGHSRSNSNSSCSISSDGSSRIESLRIQIGPRFGARDQVPAQDAPGPRSRLERLRPTGDYVDSTNSMPSTSTASTTRYSPFLDPHQPPHSAFSDRSSILARSPSHNISKARSANGDAEPQWPSSRLSASSITMA